MEKQNRIKKLIAREILDSRGEPTVEVELMTDFGFFRDSAPSGASKGKYEAVEIRDGGKRYQGKGVLKAVQNVNKIIAKKLKNRDVTHQERIDELLIDLDGTENKSKLGANAILPVSMAVCRAGAAAQNISLYQYISQLFGQKIKRESFPVSCFNIINGGVHAGNDLQVQEFMVVPQAESFSKSLQIGSEIYHILKDVLIKKFGKKATNIGEEGGFAPPLRNTKTALDFLVKAVKLSGYWNKIEFALDCAATQFADGRSYKFENRRLSASRLLNFYQKLLKNYPIISLEDPFAENDINGFQIAYQEIGANVLIIGDDLLVTNTEKMKKAFEKKLCNGLLLKINQIGTITEALESARLARSFGWKMMVSHRSGETNDDFIADLAVGISADFIKSGAPARGERLAKYNRLLKIEQELFLK
jgi:enolase